MNYLDVLWLVNEPSENADETFSDLVGICAICLQRFQEENDCDNLLLAYFMQASIGFPF